MSSILLSNKNSDMLHYFLSPIQIQQTKQLVDQGAKSLEQINNPILQILIIVLVLIIIALGYFLYTAFKERKELNQTLLKTTATDLRLLFEFESTLEHYVNQNKNRENYAKTNHEILKDLDKRLEYVFEHIIKNK